MRDVPATVIGLDLHQKHVAVLTDRCAQAEGCLTTLLNSIDPELLERHHFDWVAAVKELV
jgi:hypothetical protein